MNGNQQGRQGRRSEWVPTSVRKGNGRAGTTRAKRRGCIASIGRRSLPNGGQREFIERRRRFQRNKGRQRRGARGAGSRDEGTYERRVQNREMRWQRTGRDRARWNCSAQINRRRRIIRLGVRRRRIRQSKAGIRRRIIRAWWSATATAAGLQACRDFGARALK